MSYKCKSSIWDLLALIAIFDDFSSFAYDLEKIKKTNLEACKTLVGYLEIWSPTWGVNSGSEQGNNFINKHKESIRKIKINSFSGRFMYSVLGFSPYEQDNFKSFYDYIKEHADERKQIEDFLKKIHKLGIEYVELDEGVDFTQCVYRLDERSIIDRKDDDVYYLQNMVGIPSVDGKFIYYKTLGSNYEIHSLVNKLLCESGLHGECITVKRLGIDPKSLPEILNKENFLDPIIALKNYLTNEQLDTTNGFLDLRKYVGYLGFVVGSLSSVAESINSANSKEELKRSLGIISNNYKTILRILGDYESEIQASNPAISNDFFTIAETARSQDTNKFTKH